jgi:hypothetical protein
MATVILRRAIAILSRLLRPVLRLYSWWLPLNLGRLGEVVILADAMALMVTVVVPAVLTPFVIWMVFTELYLPLLVLAGLWCPFVLNAVVWIWRGEVRVVHLFVIVPYWVQRVPSDATFEPFQAWEDPAPEGVAFDARFSGGHLLHLGTSTSADGLYECISEILERAGWRRSTLRMERTPLHTAHETRPRRR